MMRRRQFLLGTALILGACAPTVQRRNASSSEIVDNPAFDRWVAAFRPRAVAAGIRPDVLDAAFAGQGFRPGVVARDRAQAEFSRTLEDYLALTVPESRVAEGRRIAARHAGTLDSVAARYGVDASAVAAIWGIESAFGERRGDIPVISATATLAFEGRRARFFEANLLDALRILQDGDTRPDTLLGSWAGAMGHTQIIPSTFRRIAVDFDGDGRRDIWSDDPTDALGSTGRFLQDAGWRTGAPWGLEVRLPPDFDITTTGLSRRASVRDWEEQGVRPARAERLPEAGPAAVLVPMGPTRPAFLVYRNFDCFLRYNPAQNYGIAVGYLSDRLRGGPPIAGDFGPDDTGLRLEDRRALQRALARRGYDPGPADGVPGDRTEAAVRAFQRANGLSVTGRPSRALLGHLGAAAP